MKISVCPIAENKAISHAIVHSADALIKFLVNLLSVGNCGFECCESLMKSCCLNLNSLILNNLFFNFIC